MPVFECLFDVFVLVCARALDGAHEGASKCVYVYTFVYMYLYEYMYMYVNMYMYVHVPVFVCMRVQVCV